MFYERLVEFYERLEGTTKRLEMTAILVEMLREAEPGELRPIVYLTQGLVAPEFEGVELGLAEKLVQRALAEGWNVPLERVEASYRKSGDLGETAQEVLAKGGAKRTTTLFSFGAAPAEDDERPPTVADVHAVFREIAAASGAGSQEAKKSALARLLGRFAKNPVAAKYVVRTVSGKLRLGVADMTLLDALFRAYVAPAEALSIADLDDDEKVAVKEARAALEHAYSVSSDLGRVAEAAREGPESLRRIRLTVGVPVRAMLAEREATSEAILARMGGRAAVEWKYDGLRVQAHRSADGKIRFFSRRLEDITAQYPDVVLALADAFRGKREFIVEGEVVAVDRDSGEIRPFAEVAQRRGRKHDLDALVNEVPVCVFLFDALLVDDQELMPRPFADRRAALVTAFAEGGGVTFSKQVVVDDVEGLERFFDDAVGEGAEGVMVKALDAPYRAGARGFAWIKFKRDYQESVEGGRPGMMDTLDLVVVGALAGRGRRAGGYGALLMAAYDPEADVFETVCKLGTGFDDATLASLPERLRPYLHEGPHPRVRAGLQADVWFAPGLVLEVKAFELSLSPTHTAARGVVKEGHGIALRFPRFTTRFRDDKTPEQATTTDELVTMWKAQHGGA